VDCFGGFFVKLGYFAGFPIVTSTLKHSVIYVKIGEFKKIVSQKEIKGHKNTNAPLILKIWDFIFFWFWSNYIMGHFSGYFEGASTFLTPKFRGQKSLGPLEISLEMANYVVIPQKKNNIPHFQNQWCIISYCVS
jgi:hypothetical protein